MTSDASQKILVALKEEFNIKAELDIVRDILSKQAMGFVAETRLSIEGRKSIER